MAVMCNEALSSQRRFLQSYSSANSAEISDEVFMLIVRTLIESLEFSRASLSQPE